jgi:hypothetical protein
MILALFGTGGHSTEPWYIAIPILVVAFGLRAWMWRRRGSGRRRGGGPFGGGGNGPSDGQG